MTRDPLDLLRSADPVPRPVAYPEDEVSLRVAEILDHDGRPATIDGDVSTHDRTRPRWLAAGVAAAAVLGLSVVSAIVFSRGSDNSAAGPSPVTCAVSTSGGSREVGIRLHQAEVAVGDRVRQFGGSAGSFVSDPSDGTLGFTPHGVTVARAGQACRASTVAIRPVITRPVAVATRSPRTSDPLSALRFTVPSTEAANARLTTNQRAQLTTAMSHYDCTPVPDATAAGLACSTVDGSTRVFLLGPAILDGSDVSTASADAPAVAGAGRVAWTVQLSFRPAGAARFRAFTAAHHTSSTSVAVSTCGPAGSTPCADFLAITVDGRVDTVPVTNATLESSVAISGRYDQTSAQALAADATAALVGLHPR